MRFRTGLVVNAIAERKRWLLEKKMAEARRWAEQMVARHYGSLSMEEKLDWEDAAEFLRSERCGEKE